MDIKSSKPISVSEAKEILAKRKEDGELGYEQSQALESTDKFGKYDSAKVKKLVELILETGKVSHELAVKIVDVMPDNPATLKAVLVKDKVELSDEEIASIIKELG
ncbi:MAG TPA: RNA polymerase Rpb4 family protein [Candidatus Bilamarchaeum sp.]|nr:RNA polymerase Rpb4 family protein [Candidatus Bilamarchaeum sp.]